MLNVVLWSGCLRRLVRYWWFEFLLAALFGGSLATVILAFLGRVNL